MDDKALKLHNPRLLPLDQNDTAEKDDVRKKIFFKETQCSNSELEIDKADRVR